MNERNLIVCDKDIRYAKSLGENISERKELALHVFACTSTKSVLHFKKNHEVDILLVDEAFPGDERKQMQAKQTFVLTKEGCLDLNEDETEVKKYQCVDGILGCVFHMYYEKTKDSIVKKIKKPRQRILAVYSPIHRIGKTAFALALGKELAKREKVLYLNLEDYPDVGGRLLQTEGKNLGDLFYYMRQENQDIAMRVASMVCKQEELDYISPIFNCSDRKEIQLEEWQFLFQTILEQGAYETLLLDLGDGLQCMPQMLELCDEIYMPILEDGISRRKVLLFDKNLELYHMDNVQEKTHRFVAETDMEACAQRWGKENE